MLSTLSSSLGNVDWATIALDAAKVLIAVITVFV